MEINIVDWANENVAAITRYLSNKPFSYTYNGQKIEGEYSFPNSLTTIVDYALYNCKDITKLTIPNSVTSIGSKAFRSCSGLTSVTIPNSVASIEADAFYGCSGLSCVEINIVNWANENIAATTPYLSDKPFSYTYNDEKIEGDLIISNNVTNIGKYALYKCKDISKLSIPNSVTSIGSSAFSGCSGLSCVEINIVNWANENIAATTPYLSDKPFSYTYNDEKIEGDLIISNNVTNIGKYALYKCKDISKLSIPNSVISIGGSAFKYCSGLISAVIGKSVTSIGSDAFYGCSSLTSVTIPNSVTSIGSSAFSGCSSLASVVIPNSVTGIGNYAFWNCVNLESVYVPWSKPISIDNDVFDKDKTTNKILRSLYVPLGKIKIYENSGVWQDFYDIQEWDPSEQPDPTPTMRADVNGDGVVDVADITEVAKVILGIK